MPARIIDTRTGYYVDVARFESYASAGHLMANFTAAFKRLTGNAAPTKKHVTWLMSHQSPAPFAVPAELIFPLRPVVLENREYPAPRSRLYAPFPLLSASPHQQSSSSNITADLYVPKDRVHCHAWWVLFRRAYPDLSAVPPG